MNGLELKTAVKRGGISHSPADAFFAAFREAIEGVRFSGLLDDDSLELARVAAALRAGGEAASACLTERGWPAATTRYAVQTLALAAGEWLLHEQYDDVGSLLAGLRQAWSQM